MNYNLLRENWIPVLWQDGLAGRVGVIDGLLHAHRIRQIALASPLDVFAVHRFMLTLLYWKAPQGGSVEEARKGMLDGKRIPKAVVEAIVKGAHRFDLFDKDAPFLQDLSVSSAKAEKSAGSFFAELASGTNIAHFHHGDDERLQLCCPCAALGLLRVVPWTQAGGAGLAPSVHGAPPIMALAIGDSLAATLGLNLVPLECEPGEPRWSGHFEPTDPTKPIGYLEALTWNPRRICLPALGRGTCWYCGQTGVPAVGPGIVYLKNENVKARKRGSRAVPFEWNDPAAFYSDDGHKTVKSADERAAKDNRDLRWLTDSKSSVVTANKDHRHWFLIVPCTNPANNKTFDHRLIETQSLSSDAISRMVPVTQPRSTPRALDGWAFPALTSARLKWGPCGIGHGLLIDPAHPRGGEPNMANSELRTPPTPNFELRSRPHAYSGRSGSRTPRVSLTSQCPTAPSGVC